MSSTIPPHGPVTAVGVIFTKEELTHYVVMLRRRAVTLKEMINSVPRRTSWSASVRAMTLAEYTRELELVGILHDKLSKAKGD